MNILLTKIITIPTQPRPFTKKSQEGYMRRKIETVEAPADAKNPTDNVTMIIGVIEDLVKGSSLDKTVMEAVQKCKTPSNLYTVICTHGDQLFRATPEVFPKLFDAIGKGFSTNKALRDWLQQAMLAKEKKALHTFFDDMISPLVSKLTVDGGEANLEAKVLATKKIEGFDKVFLEIQAKYLTFSHLINNSRPFIDFRLSTKDCLATTFEKVQLSFGILCMVRDANKALVAGAKFGQHQIVGVNRAYNLVINPDFSMDLYVRPSANCPIETTHFEYKLKSDGQVLISTSPDFKEGTVTTYPTLGHFYKDIMDKIAANPQAYAQFRLGLAVATGIDHCDIQKSEHGYVITANDQTIVVNVNEEGQYQIRFKQGQDTVLSTASIDELKAALNSWASHPTSESEKVQEILTKQGYIKDSHDKSKYTFQKGARSVECHINELGGCLEAIIGGQRKTFLSLHDMVVWITYQTTKQRLTVPPRSGAPAPVSPPKPTAIVVEMIKSSQFEALALGIKLGEITLDIVRDNLKTVPPIMSMDATELHYLIQILTQMTEGDVRDPKLLSSLIVQVSQALPLRWSSLSHDIQDAAKVLWMNAIQKSPLKQPITQAEVARLEGNNTPCMEYWKYVGVVSGQTSSLEATVKALSQGAPSEYKVRGFLEATEITRPVSTTLLEEIARLPKNIQVVFAEHEIMAQTKVILNQVLNHAFEVKNSKAIHMILKALIGLPEYENTDPIDIITSNDLSTLVCDSQNLECLKAVMTAFKELDRSTGVAPYFYSVTSTDTKLMDLTLYTLSTKEIRGVSDALEQYYTDAIQSIENRADTKEIMRKLARLSFYLKQKDMMVILGDPNVLQNVIVEKGFDTLVRFHDQCQVDNPKLAKLVGSILSKIFRLAVQGGITNVFDMGAPGVFYVFTDLDNPQYKEMTVRVMTKEHLGDAQFEQLRTQYNFQSFKEIAAGDPGWKLGKGTYGEVVACHVLGTTDEVVAVKIVSADTATEGDTLRGVHPGVVSAQSHFRQETDQQDFLHILFLFGKNTLGRELDKKTLGEHRKINIAHQLVTSLAELHGLEVPLYLGDIKPENTLVVIDPEGQDKVKYSDLGTAIRGGKDGLTEEINGTPVFLPPDMFMDLMSCKRGKSYSLARQDLWGLAVTLLQLMKNSTSLEWINESFCEVEPKIPAFAKEAETLKPADVALAATIVPPGVSKGPDADKAVEALVSGVGVKEGTQTKYITHAEIRALAADGHPIWKLIKWIVVDQATSFDFLIEGKPLIQKYQEAYTAYISTHGATVKSQQSTPVTPRRHASETSVHDHAKSSESSDDEGGEGDIDDELLRSAGVTHRAV